MKKNRLVGLALTALLAASAVAAVPVSAYDHMDTEEMVTTYTDELPDKLKYADVAEISLAEYIEQNPVVLSEGEDEIALEDLLVQVYSESNANDLLETLASTGTWEEQSNGSWKFLLSDGTYAVGWHEINGAWYYFGTSDRLMYTGWHKIGGYYYYFNPSGSMKHGWLSSVDKNGNTIYYYMGRPGEPDTGAMYTGGWLHDTDGKWYYIYTESDESYHGENAASGNNWGWVAGVMHTGWLELDGEVYCFKENGEMVIGRLYDGDEYVIHYFNSDGELYSAEMIEKPSVQYKGETVYPLNVRWDNLIVRDGNRITYASINGQPIDNYYESNYNSSPVSSAINYFNNDASQWMAFYSSSITDADINLLWFDFPTAFTPMYAVNLALTCCRNSEGEWTNGRINPSNYGNTYSTGTVSRAYIYLNTALQIIPNNDAYAPYIDIIVRHEIGHAIGLRHPYDEEYGTTDPHRNSLMYNVIPSQYAKDTLQPYDEEELNKTYPYNQEE